MGPLLLHLVPRVVRDYGYQLFARHRGEIWKMAKRWTGIRDTQMTPYKSKILGLDHQTMRNPGWGFENDTSGGNHTMVSSDKNK